jgi:2-polyprenyl-3-methyl-5-hydroxy-6-metoxy-1,4-benzoquinol methylase
MRYPQYYLHLGKITVIVIEADKKHFERYHGNVRHDVVHLFDSYLGKLLDVGGGLGATAAYAKEQLGAKRAVVVDAVSAAEKNQVDAHYQGSLEKESVWQQLAANEGPFDTILCLDVLEHLVDPCAAVRKCRSLLAKNGTLIVSVPNLRHWSVTVPLLFTGKFSLRDSGIMDRTHLR